MEKFIRILTVVLVLQGILTGVMAFTGPSLSGQAPDQPLVALKSADIEGITIESGEGGKVILTKKGDAWTLPDLKGFPANAGMVQTFLDALVGLKHGLPVATTSAAQSRFKVADKEFERKVTLEQSGGKKSVLFFGTSPGVKQVHARPDGLESTLTVAFGTHQAPVKVEEWLDKSLLTIPEEDLAAIEVAGLTITREEVAPPADKKDEKKNGPKEVRWNLQPLAADEKPNQQEIAKLARMMGNFSYEGLVENENEAKAALDKPALEWVLQKKKGDKIAYKLAKLEKGGPFVAQSAARGELFRIPSYVGDVLLKNIRKENLVSGPPKPEAKKEAVPGDAGDKKGEIPMMGEDPLPMLQSSPPPPASPEDAVVPGKE
ncbi:MAG: DUF4340 domain-containing protein [Magnetococcales bacterium]|nr:DUF4340 domain-containing protein [Magnetococcales bacterium]